ATCGDNASRVVPRRVARTEVGTGRAGVRGTVFWVVEDEPPDRISMAGYEVDEHYAALQRIFRPRQKRCTVGGRKWPAIRYIRHVRGLERPHSVFVVVGRRDQRGYRKRNERRFDYNAFHESPPELSDQKCSNGIPNSGYCVRGVITQVSRAAIHPLSSFDLSTCVCRNLFL